MTNNSNHTVPRVLFTRLFFFGLLSVSFVNHVTDNAGYHLSAKFACSDINERRKKKAIRDLKTKNQDAGTRQLLSRYKFLQTTCYQSISNLK